MTLMVPHCADLYQGRMCIQILLVLFCQISVISAYATSPTPWICTDPNALDSNIEISRKLPSCSLGYVLDIEDVVYESTSDNTCSGRSLCSYENKNALAFACNNKEKCNVDIRHLRFNLNKTCGSTVRFFSKYRCVPVIQELKNYSCESLTRRVDSGDINLVCKNNYRLHITMALVGISVKPSSDSTKSRFKCSKSTYWLCNHYVQDAYRSVCNSQLNRGIGDQCRIRLNDRPRLNACEHGEISNFSLVEYSCIPGESINEDLTRIDICSTKIPERIPTNRGLLHSPNYPQLVGQYISCTKQLHVSRESRLRLFMLEKSMQNYQEFNIQLLNNEPNIRRTLAKNELFDTNITIQLKDEIVEIEFKTNHVSDANFLLYFQVDSRISENAPSVFENNRVFDDRNRREKILVKRDWGVVIGCLIGLITIVIIAAIIICACRILKRRRSRSLKYIKNDDDHRQHLNAPIASNDRHPPTRGIKIEHPHLLSSPPRIIPSANPVHDHATDRETLLEHASYKNPTSTNANNFYEEIKEPQQQTNFNLGNYYEPKSFEDNRSSQPMSNYRETESRVRQSAPLATPEHFKRNLRVAAAFDAPMASTETLDVGSNSTKSEHARRAAEMPYTVAPPRMDLAHPKPSAPPLHLLQNDSSENFNPHQRLHHIQNWRNNNNNNQYM